MSDASGASDKAEPTPTSIAVGTRVEVRNTYDGSWSKGFVVAAFVDGRYRLRRRTDNAELPESFAAENVRRERKRSTWWV